MCTWLRPGGALLLTDYCRASTPPSPGFTAYVQQRGYDLHTVDAYAQLLKQAGFVDVVAEDRTWQFEKCLKRELASLEASRDEFLKDFGEEDYGALADGWREKLARVEQGEQRWGLFMARVPGG